MAQNLLQVARAIRKKPAGTAVVLLTLTLGVGINTAIFSALRGLLLRPLPYPRAAEIVRIWPERPVSIESLVFFERTARSFSELSAYGHMTLPLASGGLPEELAVGEVTPAHFDVLGVQPFLGRGFAPHERQPGHGDVLILSYRLWQRRFEGDASIVGKTVSLGGRERAVVGVMPEGYRQLYAGWEAWIPMIIDPAADIYRAWTGYQMIGRLASGISVDLGQSEVQDIVGRLHEMNPARISEVQARRATVVPLSKMILGDIGLSLVLLQGTAGLVLLIGCANVANVLIAQNLSRQRELAVRSVLGASRGRLARQLLAEGLVLGLASGLLGIVVAGWVVKTLRGTLAAVVPRYEEIQLDLGVLGFALAISLLSVLASSLLPALRAAGFSLQPALKGGDLAAQSPDSGKLSHFLIAFEIALSVVLVIGASLLAKSFWKLRKEPLGFQTAGVQTFRLRPPREHYGYEARRASYFQQVLERLSGVPGIDVVGAVNVLPLAGGDLRAPLLTQGQEITPGEPPPLVSFRVVTPELLRALGVPLLQGRALTAVDRQGAVNVGLVNQAMARAVWPGADPLGKELFRPDGSPWFKVVGVVGDTRFSGLDVKPEPQVYLPLAQNTYLVRFLYEVHPMDPLVFGVVLLFLGGWTLLAGYLPARRAAAVDPVVVLRMD